MVVHTEIVPHGITMNDGSKIPTIGLGTWQMKLDEAQQAVEDAIDMGYRHFDCALAYDNEVAIGKAIKRKLDEGVVKREELFITTKLPPVMLDPSLAREGLKISMERLQLDYVDLYLLHHSVSINRDFLRTLPPGAVLRRPEDPKNFFRNVDHVALWKELEKLRAEGLVRSIGLSNFCPKQIERIVDSAKVKPAVLQVECHAYFPQDELLAFCQANDIVMAAYSPLGSPKRWGGNMPGPILLEEPILHEVATRLGKTPAQLLLRWLLQRGIVAVPKTVNKDRLQQNFGLWDFTLDKADMEQITSLSNHGKRLHDFAAWTESPSFPF